MGGPPVGDLVERCGVEVVEFGASTFLGVDESGRLQHTQMLRDRLPAQVQPTPRCETSADLEQRLTVTLDEFVEDCPPRRVIERMEHIGHT
ncbi:Uncharacterised protein [Clostridioides difficile]|nr:Uncharacterised protein [Clostridioides difficile]